MSLNFSFFEILIIIGVTQGLVITGLIWADKKRTTSKVLLSFVLTVFNLLCIRLLILTTGLWQTRWLRYLPLSFELAIQPLIWLYVSSLITPGFKLNSKKLLHFIPFVVSTIYSVIVYITVLPHKNSIAKDVIANSFHFNNVKEAEDYLAIISSFVYWSMGFRLITKYRHWLNDNISDTDYPTYAWLKNVSLLVGILIAGLALDTILDYFFHFGTRHFLHWQLFFVYLAVLIYYLGFRGYQLPDKKNMSLPGIEKPALPKQENDIRLTVEKNRQVAEAIKSALEIKELYLDPELNLQKLAKEINATPPFVSLVINSHFQKTFRNLINEYRVEKVKQRLKDPKSNQLSILGIAYECGFNSEASFYRVFKMVVGISPNEYMKR